MFCVLVLLAAVGGYFYVRHYGWVLPSFGKKPDRNHPIGDPKPPAPPETPDDQVG